MLTQDSQLSNLQSDALLYHYTTQRGLLGIAESRSLWASSVHHLNDASEFRHALQLAKTTIQNRLRDATSAHTTLLRELDFRLWSIRNVHVFVCCFSEVGNLLSQWRAYCREGQGYSLGFDFRRSELQEAIARQGFALVRCVYDLAEQEELVRRLLDQALAAIPIASARADQGLEELAGDFAVKLARLAPQLKSPSFSEEREWRLVSGMVDIRNPRVRFREGKVMIVPYFDLQLSAVDAVPFVKQVIVGPSIDSELAMNAASALLLTKNVAQQVTRSAIPYREW